VATPGRKLLPSPDRAGGGTAGHIVQVYLDGPNSSLNKPGAPPTLGRAPGNSYECWSEAGLALRRSTSGGRRGLPSLVGESPIGGAAVCRLSLEVPDRFRLDGRRRIRSSRRSPVGSALAPPPRSSLVEAGRRSSIAARQWLGRLDLDPPVALEAPVGGRDQACR